jgi:UDP-N-acetylmuramate--alanine ligase
MDDLPGKIAETAGDGDIVICLGAGNITQWANDLPEALQKLKGDGA